MKEIPISELPIQAFYWRRCGERWLKDDDDHGSRFGETVQSYLPLPDPHEIVLSDPMTCENCWESLPAFPPPAGCPFCGAYDESRMSLDSIRTRITQWCGVTNPHV